MPGVSFHFSFELILQFVKIFFNGFVDGTPPGCGKPRPLGHGRGIWAKGLSEAIRTPDPGLNYPFRPPQMKISQKSFRPA